MSFSLATELGAKVHYHTGVFTATKNIALVGVTFVGVTALALGVLAYLHVLGIPVAAMYALGGTGSGLLLLTSGGALYLFIQHRRERNVLLQYEASQKSDLKAWRDSKDELDKDKEEYFYKCSLFSEGASDEYEFKVIFMREGDAYSIHLFSPRGESAFNKMDNRLNHAGFTDIDEGII